MCASSAPGFSRWLPALRPSALAKLPPAAREFLAALAKNPEATDVGAIKQIEARTNHDVKAVEYWLRDELQGARCGPRRTRVGALCLHIGGYQ